MIITDYTTQEKAEIKKITAKYTPERLRISKALEELKDKAERAKLLEEQQKLLEKLTDEIAAYEDELQAERFEEIRKGGAPCILANALVQVPLIIESLYKEFNLYFKGEKEDFINQSNICRLRNNKLVLLLDFTIEQIKEELSMFFDALKEDPERHDELIKIVIDALTGCEQVEEHELTQENLDVLNGIKPTKSKRRPLSNIVEYGIMNSKVSAILITEAGKRGRRRSDGQYCLVWDVDLEPNRKKKHIVTSIAFTYTGEDGRIAKNMTDFDKRVCEAISTQFYYWQRQYPGEAMKISVNEIWKTLNGKNTSEHSKNPSAASLARIADSIDKMRFITFSFNMTDEIKAYGLEINDDRIKDGYYEGVMLHADKIHFDTEKGQGIDGYIIYSEPLLFTYCRIKKQVILVPYDMLDTTAYVNDGEYVQEFKGYLMQQIQLMKNGTTKDGKKRDYFQRDPIIKIDTIYKATNTPLPETRALNTNFTSPGARSTYIRKTRKADRDKIEGLLDAWKAKGWIKGYTVLNADNKPLTGTQAAKGYKIDL